MTVRSRAAARVPGADPAAVFDVATDLATLPRAFRGRGPVPGIVRAAMEGGGTTRVGGTRVVHNADGSAVREEITALTRPEGGAPGAHGYRLRTADLRPPLSRLARGGEGAWTFGGDGAGGTLVTWELRFAASSIIAACLLAPVVLLFLGPAQRASLARIARLSEHPTGPAAAPARRRESRTFGL